MRIDFVDKFAKVMLPDLPNLASLGEEKLQTEYKHLFQYPLSNDAGNPGRIGERIPPCFL